MANTLNPEPYLRAWLLAQPTIAAAIGTAIFPDKAPQNTPLPYVDFFRVSGKRTGSLLGRSGQSLTRIQLDVWAATRSQARTIAAIIRGAPDNPMLDGYQGTMAGLMCQYANVVNDWDDYEAPINADDSGAYRSSMDVYFAFDEEST